MPKKINKGKRERQIIEAAWTVVTSAMETADTVPGLTLRKVADEAGIVLGSLRHIFKTRDDLEAAFATELIRRVDDGRDRRKYGLNKPDIAASRLANALPFGGETKALWQVEHAISVGANSHARFREVVDHCREIRRAEVETVIRTLAAGLNVSQTEVAAEVSRTLALVEGLSHQLVFRSASTIASHDARMIVEGHLRQVQGAWSASRQRIDVSRHIARSR